MSVNVAIGVQDFSTLIENHYFYVDKTAFLKEWWDSGDSVTLITRPRRFGKTLTMSMTEQFFSMEYAGRSDLFEELEIWNDEKYRNLQGTYPVISLSFANIKVFGVGGAGTNAVNRMIEGKLSNVDFWAVIWRLKLCAVETKSSSLTISPALVQPRIKTGCATRVISALYMPTSATRTTSHASSKKPNHGIFRSMPATRGPVPPGLTG